MFYHVLIDRAILNVTALNLSKELLEARVLQPYRLGTTMTLSGRSIEATEIRRIRIFETEAREWDSIDHSHVFEGKLGPPGIEVTDQYISGPPGVSREVASETPAIELPSSDSRDVFVVHGRNEQARDALFAFLRAIGLHPLEWSEVTQATGKPTPYIGQILDTAFSRAHAVIVLFTPDDEARLNEKLWEENDPDHETRLTGQARPNVLFEAGMAMGRDSDQTILVELGQLRPFSDISGLHVVRLDKNIQTWKELAKRLETAGCPVNLNGAGDFEAAVNSIIQGQPETGAEATQQSELEEKREYTDRTAQDITEEAPMHIADEETFVSPEIGKWLRVDSEVFLNFDTTLDPIELVVARDGQPFIRLFFDNERWGRQLVHRKHGDRVVAKGKIAEVEPLGLALHDCELLDLVE